MFEPFIFGSSSATMNSKFKTHCVVFRLPRDLNNRANARGNYRVQTHQKHSASRIGLILFKSFSVARCQISGSLLAARTGSCSTAQEA